MGQEPEALTIAMPIIRAMRAFNLVRKSCFGVTLFPNYKERIEDFAHLWKQCDRSITLKSHILFVHVGQFLDRMKHRFPDKGLGFWMEQAGECIHHIWENFWGEAGRKMSHSEYESFLFERGMALNNKHFGDEND